MDFLREICQNMGVIPTFLILSYLIFIFLLRNQFPSGEHLVNALSSAYGNFGYEIVAIGSMLEALILINFFTPGVLAVALGAVFAKSGVDLSLAIISGVGGAVVGYTLDFALGRFGFARLLEKTDFKKFIESAKSKAETFDWKAQILGFIHPNIGGPLAFAAGILRWDFKKFIGLAALSTLIWYILWGLLIFALGDVFLTIFTKYVFLLFMLVGAVWILAILYGTAGRKLKVKR